jgi:SWI/SNF-related matrix-associated actin-dependent regulator 1 of chromatin subfamily A
MKGEYEKWRDIWYKRNNKVYGNKLTDNEWNNLREFINNHARKATVANGANNLDELKERISHIYLRRVKEDMGTLPKKIVHELYYDLTSMQQAEYDKLWDEYEEAQLNENIDKELNKELLEGGIYRRYLSNIMVEHTQNLCDKILETEDKVIIACCYDEELNTLKEYYGDSAVVYNGKKSLKQKDKAIEDFTNNPEIKVFIGNIIAAGVGINLTRCKSLVYNNISYVAADNLQMEDRIYRLTQTRDVDIYYQIFNDTQYQHMWDIVLRKQMIADAVIKKEDEK